MEHKTPEQILAAITAGYPRDIVFDIASRQVPDGRGVVTLWPLMGALAPGWDPNASAEGRKLYAALKQAIQSTTAQISGTKYIEAPG